MESKKKKYMMLLVLVAMMLVIVSFFLYKGNNSQLADNTLSNPKQSGPIQKATDLYSSGQFNESIKILKASAASIERNNWLGWNYFKIGSLNKSLSAFEEALKYDENFNRALEGKGWCYYELGMLNKSLMYFNKSKNLGSTNGNLFAGLGYVHLRLENYKVAIENFNRANNTRPDLALIGLGEVYYSTKNYNKSIFYHKRATQKFPEKASGYIGLAGNYLELGNYTLAQKFLEKAEELMREYPEKFVRYESSINNLKKRLKEK
ncbi:MAG: tetratricopeptide repeat protein [Nanobdellota archaeon]